MMNCDNCGACCFEQGSPPGYGFLLHSDMMAVALWPDQADVERVLNLPTEAKAILDDYWLKLRAGKITGDGDSPCCWLDQQTMRCRFYEHRPQICRELDVDSEGCRSWRDEYNIDVEALT
jgi:Fe-S-cluster containining protein